MKKLLIALLLLSPLTTQAEGMYAGIGFATTTTDLKAEDIFGSTIVNSTEHGVNEYRADDTPDLYVGYSISEYWSIEAHFLDHNYRFENIQANVGSSTNVSLDTQNLSFSPVLGLPISDDWKFYLSVGLNYWRSELGVKGVDPADNPSTTANKVKDIGMDVYAAVGTGYSINENVELKFLVTKLSSNFKANASEGSVDYDTDNTTASFSAAYHF